MGGRGDYVVMLCHLCSRLVTPGPVWSRQDHPDEHAGGASLLRECGGEPPLHTIGFKTRTSSAGTAWGTFSRGLEENTHKHS